MAFWYNWWDDDGSLMLTEKEKRSLNACINRIDRGLSVFDKKRGRPRRGQYNPMYVLTPMYNRGFDNLNVRPRIVERDFY